MRKRVLITEPIDESGVMLLEREAEVIFLQETSPEGLLEAVKGVHGIIVRVMKITKEVIERADRLQVIVKHGVGCDNIDVETATRKGIPVTYTPDANLESVAEHALALMLSLARRVPRAVRDTTQGCLRQKEDYMGVELQGKVLGVIGFGRIGAEVARKCKAAFGMRVVAFDPFISEERARALGADEVQPSIDTILREADFVSIHVPLTPESKNLIGLREISLMKRTAYIVNTSRGGIIDESALYVALESGTIAGAALDVLVEEPPRPCNPLLKLDNVIVTPHLGATTREAMERMATMGAEDALRVLRGERPRYVVNPAVY